MRELTDVGPVGTALLTPILALALVLGGCRPSQNDGVPPASGARAKNIVLVTVDTLRADALSPYGNERVETPWAQRLADEGILFENAFCDTTWTIPSVASVMTGQYPFEHGLRTPHGRLGDDEHTLAELLRERGYETGAVVGSFPVDRRYGFAQGFASYDDKMSSSGADTSIESGEEEHQQPPGIGETVAWMQDKLKAAAYRSDRVVADLAIQWIDEHPSEPFFLWVHFFGPHVKPPKNLGAQKPQEASNPKARYLRDVEELDVQLGRLLQRIDRDRRSAETAIILHSDHGETFDKHPTKGHGFNIYDSTAHIPLIIRLPDRQRHGERISTVARNVDIFATVLSLTATELPADLPSRDLLGPLDDGRYAYIETRFAQPMAGIRTQRWKLIVRREHGREGQPREIELYDVEADPDEAVNLADTKPEQVQRLRAMLEQERQGATQGTATEAELAPEALEKLRVLGYLNGPN